MSLAARLRSPGLLVPLAGALLALGVLGPGLRGAAAAGLAALAGTLALRAGSRPAGPGTPRALRVVDRLELGPRLFLVLVEVAGRRFLVTTGTTVTPLPLEEPR